MGILNAASELNKQEEIDEILGFLTALEKVKKKLDQTKIGNKCFFSLKAVPSEKKIKQNLMNNEVYNEYNLEELENSFRFVSWINCNGNKLPLQFIQTAGESEFEVEGRKFMPGNAKRVQVVEYLINKTIPFLK